MSSSAYTVEQERQINASLTKILDLLDIQVPEDHFGTVVLTIPRQNGKIAGEIDVNLRSRHRRNKATS